MMSSSSAGSFAGSSADHRVEQVAAALPYGGAHPDGIAETQLVEVEVGAGTLQIVQLVHHQDHGATGPPQALGDGLVHRMHARLAVHEEQHDVGFLERELHLPTNGTVHRLVRLGD